MIGDIIRDLAHYSVAHGISEFGIALEAANQCPVDCKIDNDGKTWEVRVV